MIRIVVGMQVCMKFRCLESFFDRATDSEKKIIIKIIFWDEGSISSMLWKKSLRYRRRYSSRYVISTQTSWRIYLRPELIGYSIGSAIYDRIGKNTYEIIRRQNRPWHKFETFVNSDDQEDNYQEFQKITERTIRDIIQNRNSSRINEWAKILQRRGVNTRWSRSR